MGVGSDEVPMGCNSLSAAAVGRVVGFGVADNPFQRCGDCSDDERRPERDDSGEPKHRVVGEGWVVINDSSGSEHSNSGGEHCQNSFRVTKHKDLDVEDVAGQDLFESGCLLRQRARWGRDARFRSC